MSSIFFNATTDTGIPFKTKIQKTYKVLCVNTFSKKTWYPQHAGNESSHNTHQKRADNRPFILILISVFRTLRKSIMEPEKNRKTMKARSRRRVEISNPSAHFLKRHYKFILDRICHIVVFVSIRFSDTDPNIKPMRWTRISYHRKVTRYHDYEQEK